MKIRIADFLIDWDFTEGDLMDRFVCEDEGDPVLKISSANQKKECYGIQYIDCATDHVLQRFGSSVELLCANNTWSDVTVFSDYYKDPDYSLPLAAICSRFAGLNTIFLHGSFVDFQGNGVIFTGYSGIGKTTQARLWQEFLYADIINGDKVFLRVFNDSVMAYGSPWRGSSEYCVNQKSPLKGIVVLKQSTENKIKKLNPVECVELFMPHVFLPRWDEENLLKAIDTFNVILEKIPVWLLECRPDEDAVRLTKDTIFNTEN